MSDKAIDLEAVRRPESPSGERARAVLLARGPGVLRTLAWMARATFREAVRRKILLIALIAGAGFLGLFWAGLHSIMSNMAHTQNQVNRREAAGMVTMMALYAGSMMTSLMAALTSCDTLAGEIASGTIHAIATKPVCRWSLVLGKWVGFVWLLTLYVLFLEGGTIVIEWLESRNLPLHTAGALALIWLQAVLLLGVTMACSTRFSALTSGACTLGLYGLAFIGGWIEQFGALRHVQACVNLGIVASLIMPSDALWRRAAFKIQPPLLGAAGVSPFSSTTVPSAATVVYAIAYAVLALLVAQILFERRDL
ncbi:MAG TPA: ABC transporter permease [Terracidiphilus sp.]|nr:ABC transporter permease [Terracidiphilus sp.]